jgi:hypothetical protein
MPEHESEPLLVIDCTVNEHDTKEYAKTDKADEFTICFNSLPKTLKIGMQEAKAQLKVKAFDDIVKTNFPKKAGFIIKIYRKQVSANIDRKKTEATTL